MIFFAKTASSHMINSNPLSEIRHENIYLSDRLVDGTRGILKGNDNSKLSYNESIRDLTKDSANIAYASYPKVSMVYGIDNSTKLILLCILICLCILVISTTLKCFENVIVVRKRNSRDLVKQLEF